MVVEEKRAARPGQILQNGEERKLAEEVSPCSRGILGVDAETRADRPPTTAEVREDRHSANLRHQKFPAAAANGRRQAKLLCSAVFGLGRRDQHDYCVPLRKQWTPKLFHPEKRGGAARAVEAGLSGAARDATKMAKLCM
ncbi:unnamed protein product [Heligmosomoides polygyrus]|uniref:Uncharacterized protein n=1 Tax=Heligmosomoides polygyrus TaxID=6339 RepID=A0A183GKA6_HELPZ|nr:unnamed protein product [Heligmosomoides polygyrus]